MNVATFYLYTEYGVCVKVDMERAEAERMAKEIKNNGYTNTYLQLTPLIVVRNIRSIVEVPR